MDQSDRTELKLRLDIAKELNEFSKKFIEATEDFPNLPSSHLTAIILACLGLSIPVALLGLTSVSLLLAGVGFVAGGALGVFWWRGKEYRAAEIEKELTKLDLEKMENLKRKAEVEKDMALVELNKMETEVQYTENLNKELELRTKSEILIRERQRIKSEERIDALRKELDALRQIKEEFSDLSSLGKEQIELAFNQVFEQYLESFDSELDIPSSLEERKARLQDKAVELVKTLGEKTAEQAPKAGEIASEVVSKANKLF